MEENVKEVLFNLVSRKQFRQLKDELCEMNEFDIASFLEELDSEKQIIIFRMLPKELASDVFACLEVETQEHIINSITDKELAYIIEELYVDDAVDMLEELPATIVKRVLQNAAPSTRLQINEFLKYPENSAGSIMTAEYIGLKKNITVQEAFAYIRKHGYDKETIYTCYVMDAKRMLEGVVTVKDLLMNDYDVKIEDIMDTNVIKAVTTDDKEDIADLFNKYDLLSLPVVDHENRLVGIVTIDDAVDVMEEEATEDFEKMAAMLPSEKPYLKTSVLELAKNRITWLLVLMISSMLTGGILTKYEDAFQVMPLLVSFVPMLTDTGGNAGSQSSTMIIRGMTIGEIASSDILKVIWKEARVSVVVGLILGLVNFIRLVIQYPGQPVVALTVVLALFATVFLAKVIGGMLPILAKKLKLDPAIMAAPLITTIVDAVSLVIYFQIAVELLHIK
ncbi:magnesium transporter [Lachnoanaerobaculum umeaense]|uniref:Magnesium transporter MgtE n=1 Tax=Lachnoanaerobaculum umeaense TaxID=617123 RepID=A0A385Q035_9FIRM|nr:magnesium transporter [Lachnoanaerobaculum umeaense]AYA99622.1 magnesium transporter [Lachnoanaerobaculum umeaense]PZW98640.1 Mg2+ transporter MgtE [Lachnoanaerobaculum umeaense]